MAGTASPPRPLGRAHRTVVAGASTTLAAPPGSAAPDAPPTGPSGVHRARALPGGDARDRRAERPDHRLVPGRARLRGRPGRGDLRPAHLPPGRRAGEGRPDAPFPTDAYPDLPAAEPEGQPFPLVLFSHGFCGYRQQSSFLTTTIASWGFVVAAPEHAARDLTACLSGTIGQGASTDVQDLRAAIPILEAENLKEDGPLATIVDTTRLAVVGHSAGGSAAIQMSGDPNVATYVAMAAGNGPPPAATPGLYMAGDADVIAPAATIEQWWTTSVPSPQAAGRPRRGDPPRLHGPVHDRGRPGRRLPGGGAVGGGHPRRHRPPDADGCSPSHTPAPTAWPAIRHLTIAQLRSGFGDRPGPRRARRVAGRRLPRPDRPLPVRLTAAPLTSFASAIRALGGRQRGHERPLATVRRRGIVASRARPAGRRGPGPAARRCETVTSAGATGGP